MLTFKGCGESPSHTKWCRISAINSSTILEGISVALLVSHHFTSRRFLKFRYAEDTGMSLGCLVLQRLHHPKWGLPSLNLDMLTPFDSLSGSIKLHCSFLLLQTYNMPCILFLCLSCPLILKLCLPDLCIYIYCIYYTFDTKYFGKSLKPPRSCNSGPTAQFVVQEQGKKTSGPPAKQWWLMARTWSQTVWNIAAMIEDHLLSLTFWCYLCLPSSHASRTMAGDMDSSSRCRQPVLLRLCGRCLGPNWIKGYRWWCVLCFVALLSSSTLADGTWTESTTTY